MLIMLGSILVFAGLFLLTYIPSILNRLSGNDIWINILPPIIATILIVGGGMILIGTMDQGS